MESPRSAGRDCPCLRTSSMRACQSAFMAAQRCSAMKWTATAATAKATRNTPRMSRAHFQAGIRRPGVSSCMLFERGLPAALQQGLEIVPGLRVEGIRREILQFLGIGDLVVQLDAGRAAVPFGVAPAL